MCIFVGVYIFKIRMYLYIFIVFRIYGLVGSYRCSRCYSFVFWVFIVEGRGYRFGCLLLVVEGLFGGIGSGSSRLLGGNSYLLAILRIGSRFGKVALVFVG